MSEHQSSGSTEPKTQYLEGDWDGRKVRYRSGRVVLKLSKSVLASGSNPEEYLQNILDTVPGSVCVRTPSRSGRALISVPENMDVPALAAELARRDDLDYAEPDVVDTEAGSG